MRLQQRLVFATPFLLVAACKTPVAEPVEPQVAEAKRDAPADAQPDVSHDAPPSVVARIINIVVHDDGVAITTNRGTDDGIAQGWRGCVVDDSERCVLGGDFVVAGANGRTSTATVKLTSEQLRAHPRVKLDPP